MVVVMALSTIQMSTIPVQASTYHIVNAANAVHAYQQQTPTSSRIFDLAPGQNINILCQDYGVTTAHGTNIWDLIRNPYSLTGADGWISDYYASTPNFNAFSPGLPRCFAPLPPPPPGGPGSLQILMAISRAAAQIGRVYQPDGRTPWACWCDHFAAFVYGRASSGYSSAQAHYSDLLHRGMVHYDRNPPTGALVFYDYPNGHVVFSLGSGNIITTPSCGTLNPVYQTTFGHFNRFLGWSWPNPEWFA